MYPGACWGILMLFDSLVRDWVVADLLPNDGVC